MVSAPEPYTLLLTLSEFTFTMPLRNSVPQAQEADSSAGVSLSGWVTGCQEDEASAVTPGQGSLEGSA